MYQMPTEGSTGHARIVEQVRGQERRRERERERKRERESLRSGRGSQEEAAGRERKEEDEEDDEEGGRIMRVGDGDIFGYLAGCNE